VGGGMSMFLGSMAGQRDNVRQ